MIIKIIEPSGKHLLLIQYFMSRDGYFKETFIFKEANNYYHDILNRLIKLKDINEKLIKELVDYLLRNITMGMKQLINEKRKLVEKIISIENPLNISFPNWINMLDVYMNQVQSNLYKAALLWRHLYTSDGFCGPNLTQHGELHHP